MIEQYFGWKTVACEDEQNVARIRFGLRGKVHKDKQRQMTAAPKEMLRHREGDLAGLTMAEEKQRAVRMDLFDVLHVAQRERLDLVLGVIVADVKERTKSVDRLLRAERRRQILELVILL